MTTTVATRPSPTVRTARVLGAVLLSMAGIFWALAVVAVVIATLVVWRVNGSADVSIAVYARQAATWFPFSLGIMLVGAYLRVHIASGVTRRTFVRAALLVELAAGVGYAAVFTALVLLERAVHDALGWESVITEIQLADESASTGAMLLELSVTFVVANLSGLLVGAVYLRFGAWVGTLTLPLTVGPLVLLLYIPGARYVDLPGIWTTTAAGHLALAVGVGVVLAAAMAAVFAALVERLQLAPAP
ncbi:hypothetical protein J1G44_03755 [Cellulomonas sp. zg-ZUI199]|uniref:ABC transporter permease n=1 Tax=Cellulomonas wangleii TaxID=2816956 RepID=A0ABX8D3H6_9CELL|nr:hypothetical protein [Cellulomonas wangleii]MBO0923595.1 hypothetical protein [Cellulomonas wangleii]QVI61919.1 hypothetical protein KG103_16040 [Cellulomonas wangleii]